eukprot:Seg1956.5 transcript_id=Seg1956.5/GoldUCD/mRNA.D3Y31 product="hypothetical protein" protein_id=Seg1956.5/GoldUCD/D3Y31
MWWTGENSWVTLCLLIIHAAVLVFGADSQTHNALGIKDDAWHRMGKRNLRNKFTTSGLKQNANLWDEMEADANMWMQENDAASENKRSTEASREVTDSSNDLQPGMWGKRGQPGMWKKRIGGKSWGKPVMRRRQAISNVWQKLIKYIEKRSKLDKDALALATALEGLSPRNHRLPAFLGILKLYTECCMREGNSVRPKPNPTENPKMEQFSTNIKRPEWQFFKSGQDN